MFTRHSAALVCAALLPNAGPASANDPAVRPEMTITIYATTSTHEVCWTGRLRSTAATNPTWRVVTVGVRSDSSPILDGPRIYSATSVSDCATIDKRDAITGGVAAAGFYTTTFSYDGLGPDIPSTAHGIGLWENGRDTFFVTGH